MHLKITKTNEVKNALDFRDNNTDHFDEMTMITIIFYGIV